jgi:RND superfamily putative drug exporter
VLTVAAALGLTVFVFQGLLGYEELAFFVPVATSILLLALGADYNVFLISRIWREADRQDLRGDQDGRLTGGTGDHRGGSDPRRRC